jgi:hydrogenase/urease accessory protein HupE
VIRAVEETTELRCDPPDMLGAVVRVDGLADSRVNVVVRIARADGNVHHAILDTGTPQLTIAAPEDESHSFFEYLVLGIDHLLTGWDHLTFVLGLLVLFGWRRRLIAAVTAFTLGHSLTLALSVLGIVSVPMALVEALIALTIVVLALEIQSGQRGPVWKHPWALPGALGLLHGLGFARHPRRAPFQLEKQPHRCGVHHRFARRILGHRADPRGVWDRGLAGLRATRVDQAKRPGCGTVRGGAVLGRREVATELGGCPVFVEGRQERFRHIGQFFVEVPRKEDALLRREIEHRRVDGLAMAHCAHRARQRPASRVLGRPGQPRAKHAKMANELGNEF